jgi:hypothetical protein
MSLLPECPSCGGLMTYRKSQLSSACRCGYPDTVEWNGFAERRVQAQLERELRFTIEQHRTRRASQGAA